MTGHAQLCECTEVIRALLETDVRKAHSYKFPISAYPTADNNTVSQPTHSQSKHDPSKIEYSIIDRSIDEYYLLDIKSIPQRARIIGVKVFSNIGMTSLQDTDYHDLQRLVEVKPFRRNSHKLHVCKYVIPQPR